MSNEIEKTCSRCQIVFECKSDDIINCQCALVALDQNQRDKILEQYDDCLCANCLEQLRVKYKINVSISVDQFIDLLLRSSLSERRPIDDRECLQGMVNNSNLMITAWDGEKLIGIARSMTDFYYACYLSDLAVDKQYQKTGVGRKLQLTTQEQLGEKCKLILISAPDANSYYENIGYTNNQRCWVLDGKQKLD
ncbi:MAG: cysteine-rich CWC family protein [Gammaproteobacteria bacterium]|nr:cysteine-rich CWC family protein [Gammaproteobacteria bacterium]